MLIYGSGIAVDLLISDPVVSVRNVVLCAIKILTFWVSLWMMLMFLVERRITLK